MCSKTAKAAPTGAETFRYNMLKYCERNDIQNGEYIFRSHDYRHTIATCFYDSGVSLQSIRDYLGHDYEEMTEQYIDYMPRRSKKRVKTTSAGTAWRHTSREVRKKMDEKIYLRLLYGMEEIPDGLARIIGRNPCYDLAGLPSPKLKGRD